MGDSPIDKTVLRFSTIGSVDDGKSTLIGRLLYDTNCIPKDQYEAIKQYSEKRGKDIDYSFLLDGLESEREQGITIDVAYRYFETDKRKFIVADTPGHEQYTRNMVTGASNSDVAIILIDAEAGITEQSKRHGFIASLLGIPYLIVAINKMDLVGYSRKRFEELSSEYKDFCSTFDVCVKFIPVCALNGDNVSERSGRIAMEWYDGESLLHELETIQVPKDNMIDFRFPVQMVIRTDKDFRGYAGKVASGSIRKGESIIVLPSMKVASINTIETFDGVKDKAVCPDSVVLTLDKEIDISRGDMIVRANNQPTSTHLFKSIVCWMSEDPCYPYHSDKYILKHSSKEVLAQVKRTLYKFNIDNLSREKTNSLELNDIGKLEIETTQDIFADPYKNNKSTGSFILIDPNTNETVGAGMIVSCDSGDQVVTNEGMNNCTIWLTGMPCSGKTTIAQSLQMELTERNVNAICLDGDDLRSKLNEDLGFSPEDRKENLRRASHISQLFNDKGIVVISSFVSPTNDLRDKIHSIITNIKLVYVKCSAEECANRDVKGMWARAKSGEIKGFTGYDAPFDDPINPDLVLDTEKLSKKECVDSIIAAFFS